MSQWLSGKSLALIGPAKRLCHRSVEIRDKGQHFGLESSDRGKGAAFEQLAGQNAEPNLNLVHPGSVLIDESIQKRTNEIVAIAIKKRTLKCVGPQMMVKIVSQFR